MRGFVKGVLSLVLVFLAFIVFAYMVRALGGGGP